MKTKLTSRKFWVALAGIIINLVLFIWFGLPAADCARNATILAGGYIGIEGAADIKKKKA